MKIGIIRFLGTNCDYDVQKWILNKGYQTEFISYRDHFELKKYDAVILPGGFSYGDYLRCGALAAKSSAVKSLKSFADSGRMVLGICNGFQILCEAGLLPGVLLQNQQRKFINEWTDLELVNAETAFTTKLNQAFTLPIAHGDGRFFISNEELQKLQQKNQIWIRYKNNPNGSVDNIAGVFNEKKNVAGLMPHPERAIQDWMGGTAGMAFL